MFASVKLEQPTITPEILYLFMSVLLPRAECEAVALFDQAIRSIGMIKKFDHSEMQIAYTLFRLINPIDDEEGVWCAQFIITYVLGMKEQSRGRKKNKATGQLLMQASQDAIERIYKKRNGTANENAMAQVKEGQIIC